jgi:hypothetical protein
MNDRPRAMALLVALSHDLAGLRVQLDFLSDDELTVLRHALWDVATELRLTLADRGGDLGAFPVGDTSCDGSDHPGRRCPAPDCHRLLTSTRSHYCSGRCRMRALRQRRALSSQTHLVEETKPPGRRPVDHCVFECAACDERYIGERRCPQCNLFTRNLGLGAPCPDCDHPIVLAELIPEFAAGRGSPPTDGKEVVL